MKLMIRQTRGDYRERFLIFDEKGELKYYVWGTQRNQGETLKIQDRKCIEYSTIRQRNFFFLIGYSIEISGIHSATLLQNPVTFHTLLKVRGVDWTIRGNLREKTFEVIGENQEAVMTHTRKWDSKGEWYELEVRYLESEPLCLAIAICIDIILPIGGGAIVAINS